MNDAQRVLVIGALVLIGVGLGWFLLDWDDGNSLAKWPILIFYYTHSPQYPNFTFRHGVYTAPFVPYLVAVFAGMILPLCLFALAAFLALGRRR